MYRAVLAVAVSAASMASLAVPCWGGDWAPASWVTPWQVGLVQPQYSGTVASATASATEAERKVEVAVTSTAPGDLQYSTSDSHAVANATVNRRAEWDPELPGESPEDPKMKLRVTFRCDVSIQHGANYEYQITGYWGYATAEVQACHDEWYGIQQGESTYCPLSMKSPVQQVDTNSVGGGNNQTIYEFDATPGQDAWSVVYIHAYASTQRTGMGEVIGYNTCDCSASASEEVSAYVDP